MAKEGDKLDSLLGDARRHEKDYDWIRAAESYREAFELVPEKDYKQRGETAERQSYALYKSAFQAEDNGQFRDRIRAAAELCKKAKEEYEKDGSSVPKAFRCGAMILLLNYWIATEAAEKKRLVNESWKSTKEALSAFERNGDDLGYAHAFNQLSMAAGFASMYEMDPDVLKQLLLEGLSCAEKSISVLSRTSDPSGLARAYMQACRYQQEHGSNFADSTQRLDQKAYSYLSKARDLSEETALTELPSVSSFIYLPIPAGPELSAFLDKALQLGRRINDRLVIGTALREFASDTNWKIVSAQDSNERESSARRTLELARECRRELSIIQYESPPPWGEVWVMMPESGVYGILAYVESDARRKREFAEKALTASLEYVRLAEMTGIRDIIGMAHHQFGYNLTSLAKTEPDTRRKRALLEKALQERDISREFGDRYSPSDHWSRGTDLSLRAEAEVELADLEENTDVKMGRLREAIQHKKDSLDLHSRSLSVQAIVDLPDYAIIGYWLIQYSGWLEKLHSLDGDRNTLRTAGEAWTRTANAFESAGVPPRVAEAYWKAAQIFDDLGEYTRSAENFALSSNSYRAAAEKLPQLKDLYEDHAVYMQAWSEIERAKSHHAKDEPRLAKEFYEKAALLHRSTKRWRHLATIYAAWAQVENAEDLSREDKCTEASVVYKLAENLFKESRNALQGMIGSAQETEEAQMATRIVKAAGHREAFCRARIVLEEARLLDKQGDSLGSSEKYGSAAEMFMKVLKELDKTDNRKEIELIATLSRAWQAMARAEAEASPGLYGEASVLFDQAKELASSEKARLMSMGHSRFCKALEAGAKFSDTGEVSLHASASKDLESAAKYYLKADLLSAAEYSKASKLLFDSYVYMDKAGREEDQDAKAKFYAMAEKVLGASAISYEKADQPGKKSQVLKLLAKVKEDRELALSLTEVLRAPDVVSTTMAFSTPTPARERAAGIERFEHADIQATLVAKPKELHVGQELNLEIEMVNAGRGAAQLTKIEETIPKGFVIVQEPEMYRMDDRQINLKGRRLDALKTEDLRLVLRPTTKGNFKLNPRIMYLDESGTSRLCEPVPVEVAVKEMGISGWLRGT
jgi:hypothetical protein